MTITAIMGAMPDEVEQLCALLDGVTVEPYAGVTYHRGLLGEKPVVVCCAGMGKANARRHRAGARHPFGADRIIFSGIAGNMTDKVGIGDVVVGKTVLYHDAEDDMIAQSAPFTACYEGDPELVKAALDACDELGVKAIAGTIATGDQFVGDSATKAAIAEKVHPDCVEMEGAAVSQIAAKNGVPCVILRAMSDNADEAGHVCWWSRNSASPSMWPPPPRSWRACWPGWTERLFEPKTKSAAAPRTPGRGGALPSVYVCRAAAARPVTDSSSFPGQCPAPAFAARPAAASRRRRRPGGPGGPSRSRCSPGWPPG